MRRPNKGAKSYQGPKRVIRQANQDRKPDLVALTFSPDVKYVLKPSSAYDALTSDPNPPSVTPSDSRYSARSVASKSVSSASTCG